MKNRAYTYKVSRKKKIIVFATILAVVSAILITNLGSLKDRYAIWNYHTQWFDRDLIRKTNTELDKDMFNSRADVGPALQGLGYTLSDPSKSTCGEGDPQLYKYFCYTEAIILPQNNPIPNVLPPKISSATLSSFSDQMAQKHWKPSEANQYVLTWFDSYAFYNKPESFGLSFDKENCSFYLHLQLPINTKTQPRSRISCAKTLLDGYYY